MQRSYRTHMKIITAGGNLWGDERAHGVFGRLRGAGRVSQPHPVPTSNTDSFGVGRASMKRFLFKKGVC